MATKKKATTMTKNNQQTLSEFQAWLEGAESLQPKDWVPNKEQWKLIRTKIKNIVSDPSSELAVPSASATPAPMNPLFPNEPSLPRQGNPPVGYSKQTTVPNSDLFAGDLENVEMSAAAKEMLRGSNDPNAPTKTAVPLDGGGSTFE